LKTERFPVVTLVLVLATIVVSLSVNYLVTDTLLGKAKITQLIPFGGFTLDHLLRLELWRLFVAQFIHAKQVHMFYNALCLFLLGCFLERTLGRVQFVSIWFLVGSFGTLVSTFTVPAPWNLGTGGSQAVLALAASGIALYVFGINRRRWFVFVLGFTVLPALLLDIVYASNHLPKLGHVTSIGFGFMVTALLIRGRTSY